MLDTRFFIAATSLADETAYLSSLSAEKYHSTPRPLLGLVVSQISSQTQKLLNT